MKRDQFHGMESGWYHVSIREEVTVISLKMQTIPLRIASNER